MQGPYNTYKTANIFLLVQSALDMIRFTARRYA